MRKKIIVGRLLTTFNGSIVEIVKVFKNRELFIVQHENGSKNCVSLDEVKAGYYKF